MAYSNSVLLAGPVTTCEVWRNLMLVTLEGARIQPLAAGPVAKTMLGDLAANFRPLATIHLADRPAFLDRLTPDQLLRELALDQNVFRVYEAHRGRQLAAVRPQGDTAVQLGCAVPLPRSPAKG